MVNSKWSLGFFVQALIGLLFSGGGPGIVINGVQLTPISKVNFVS